MKRTTMVALAALFAVPSFAFAHGDAKPGGNAPAAKREQTAWGIAGDPRRAKRTIEIDMSDRMRFSPDQITVMLGETVRLRVRNSGRQPHELVLGTERELKAHAALMQKHPGMEHDEAYMAHVDSGKTGEIVWQFNRAGSFLYGCLVPGHWDAGMVGHLRVVKK